MSRCANRRNTGVSFFLAVLALTTLTTSAAAQTPGVRGGISVDPEQFFLGGHFESAPLIERLHFKPNLEVGFGDDVTHVGVNFEFVYKLPLDTGAWTLYAGGGPALNIYSFEGIDDSANEPGLNALFGAETERGLFFELKLGAVDSPRVKFAVGWNFR
jgi:hypothetical protein